MRITRYSAIFCCVLLSFGAAQQNARAADAENSFPRQKILLDAHWHFKLGDPEGTTAQFDYPEFARLDKHRPDDEKQAALLAPKQIDAAANHIGESLPIVSATFDDSSWRTLTLPHDWAIELPFDKMGDKDHGYKALGPEWNSNIGWYRRTLELPASDAGKSLELNFEGVYRNALVWLNGHCLGRNLSGYSSFNFDVTKYALPGRKNELVVRVDATRKEGWFYEGAGIYRHVWLTVTNPVHIATWGTFVTSEVATAKNDLQSPGDATLTVQTDIQNDSAEAAKITLITQVFTPSGNALPGREIDQTIPPQKTVTVTQTIPVAHAKLWSLESRYMYTVDSGLRPAQDGGPPTLDQTATPFGIRTLKFDPDAGFFLNGKHVTIQGTANHPDFAGVGIAVPDELQKYRIMKLKEAGCNAWRMAHGDPNPELLDACDRLGMLVLDEHRRTGNTPEILSQIDRLVRRDRNHPSIFLWCIGNEELSAQGSDAFAQSVAKPMQDLVHKLDPSRLCTFAMNWDWGNGFSKVIDVQGFNYLLQGTHGNESGKFLDMDKFHAAFPDKPTIGTEESSAESTRGIYENVKGSDYLPAYAQSLPRNGDKIREWGSTAEVWTKYYAARPWNAGAFVWTGFDYRGEPTPFGWPQISGNWGMLDMCGFPKDSFYYYQSVWTDKPVLHVLPHWNWAGKEGKPIEVWVYANLDEVELLLNGTSLGKKPVEKFSHPAWQVLYAPGTLLARGFKGGAQVAEDKVETTGPATQLALTPDKRRLRADGEDPAVVKVSLLDDQGRLVPTANDHITFEITGGKILGVGNGDPTSHEADNASERSAFNGLAMVIVQSLPHVDRIELTARSGALKPAVVTIECRPAPSRLDP